MRTTILASTLALLAAAAHAQTSVAVVFTPHASVVGATQVVSFAVPLPAGLLSDSALVRLTNESGTEIPIYARSLGAWRNGHTGIRSLLIQFETQVPAGPWQATVTFGLPRTLDRVAETPVRSTWRLVTEGSFDAPDGVYEPAVLATLPAEWLAGSGLLSFGSTAGRYAFLRVPVDDPMEQFYPHLVNQFNPFPATTEQNRYRTDYEPWLYDRAQALFQLYVRTGRVDVFREAHRAAQFYQSQLYKLADCPATGLCVGQFRFRVPSPTASVDAKYSYTASLATDYWLTGDPDLLPKIPDAAYGSIAEALPAVSFTQPTRFTERNFAVALTGAAHHYDVTGDELARTRTTQLLDALQAMQETPPNALPANGCFHYRPEEAGGAWGFSPWMSALLGHGLYRAWESFGEARALSILGRLAQCVAERGVARPYATTSPAWWYSRYLGTSDGALEFVAGDPWPDGEHSVDVAYLMALGAWSLPAGPGQAHLQLMAHRLLRSQQLSLGRSYQPTGYPGNGLALYRMSPPRKYAWWFAQSPALGRLLGDGPAELAAAGVAFPEPQGGLSMEGDLALSGPAPAGGLTVELTSSRPDLAQLPASVPVEEGQAYAVFPLITSPVTAPEEVTLTASLNGVSRSVAFVLRPPSLARILRAASVVGGGATTSARVELNGPAPDGGVTVALANGSPSVLSMPATLAIPAGALSASFGIVTAPVGSGQTASYSASLNGTTASASISVQPFALNRVSGPSTLTRGVTVNTGSVALNAPAPAGGVTVLLNSSDPGSLTVPVSVSVAAGASSAAFPIAATVDGAAAAVTITGSLAGVVRSVVVNLQQGVLSSLLLSPVTTTGGVTTSGHRVSLTSAAPTGGVAVSLSASDPSALTLPASVVVPAGATSRTFSITAASSSQQRVVQVIAEAGGEMRGVPLTITPDQFALLSLAAGQAQGGTTLAGNLVQLAAPAPAGGAVVLLTSSHPLLAPVPESVTIPAGQSSAPFSIPTTAPATEQMVTIQAVHGALTGSATLRILPMVLTGLTLAQASIPGGSVLRANTVRIGSPAPAGGLAILLESSHPDAVAPASVLVPAGATTASFDITTGSPPDAVEAVIRARLGAQVLSANLTVSAIQPAALTIKTLSMAGGFEYTGNIVKLSRVAPPGGLSIQLSSSQEAAMTPASVVVAEGTDTATFAIVTRPVQSLTPVSFTASAGGGSLLKTGASIRPPVLSAVLLAMSTGQAGTQYTANRATLNAPAPAAGFEIQLAASHPAHVTVPASVTIPAGSNMATFPVTLGGAIPPGVYTITATRDGVTKTDTFEVTASSAGLLSSVTLSPATLSAAAPVGGALVTLTSSHPASATVPASVTVPAGQTYATFTVSTAPVAAALPVTVTASLSGSSKSGTLTVQPAKLSLVSAYPTALIGGRSTTQSKVSLNGLAADGGFPVQLSSSNPALVAVPPTVTVPAGQLSVIYTATTQPVATATPVTLTASAGGVVKTAVLTVQPPALSLLTPSPTAVDAGSTTTGHLVKLSGAAPPGGFLVSLASSNPAVLAAPPTVTVPSGASQVSVPLTAGSPPVLTSVTITATAGGIARNAIVKVFAPK
jgi:hypothetical protein